MLLPSVETLPLEAPLAHFRAFGWARLGPIAAPAALEALRTRAEQLMLGEVVHPGLFFQHDSESGSYGDVPRGRGWQGPSLRYRKLEKLERDPIFAAFIGNPLFARIARGVIGPDVSLCRAVLFTKAARGGTELPWHQDGGSFWGLSRDPELQIWTALDDAPVASGCVELVPATHLAGLATPLGGVIPEDVVARSGNAARSILVPARAGEALLIHNHCWHRSGRNATGAHRRALTVCLMDAATRCTRRRSPRHFQRLLGG
ncbi:MAG TPA: phytanoyl-CoA dioxygenase family protein [Anaeromyxobacteraceae bacterium]|nr:phytanoyl-CoA dioxygenase family protein [Anaeromyxobacteraceae bacterium]